MVFSMSATKAAAIIAFLSAAVNGHIIMTSPEPFEFAVSSTAQSPLSDSGADFPCKFPAGFTPTQHSNNAPMAAGSSDNILSFKGGATHGGGSCQVSITSDTAPTKDSKWQVIKSIEGGCPSDAPGNLGTDANAPIPTTFKYTIPSDVAAGKYTLAWTWFNRIGNREMYMNCAPITVGGGSAKRAAPKINKKRQSALPSMFMANIGNGCGTLEGSDVIFPDPGSDLQKGSGFIGAKPSGSCPAAAAAPVSGSSGSSSGDAPTPASSPASEPTTAPGNFAEDPEPKAGGAETPEPTSAPAPITAPTTPAPAPAPASAPAPAPASGSSGSAGTACSDEGSWICAADGTSFTRCASGTISAPMQMAAGTKCTPGESATLDVKVTRRSARFARRS